MCESASPTKLSVSRLSCRTVSMVPSRNSRDTARMTNAPTQTLQNKLSIDLEAKCRNVAHYLREKNASHCAQRSRIGTLRRCDYRRLKILVAEASRPSHDGHNQQSSGGAENEQRDLWRVGSCADLCGFLRRDNGTSNLRRPVEIIRPAIGKPGDHLVVFARREGFALVVESIEEAPVTGGQAAQSCQADLAGFGIRRGARHEV